MQGIKNGTVHSPHYTDIVGKRYTRGIVIRYFGVNETRQKSVWELRCDCGNIYKATTNALNSGQIKSCGCLWGENKRRGGFGRLPPGVAGFRAAFNDYVHSAKYRSIPFELTYDDFRAITKQNCYYCGREPSQKRPLWKSEEKYVYNGIDRIDSKLGYILGNVRPCCKMCNFAKRNHSETVFLEWVEQVYKHLELGKS